MGNLYAITVTATGENGSTVTAMAEYPQREYIVRETEYPMGYTKAEEVGELVRCKDCKFYYRMTAETGICELACRHLGNDGFCSEGERKDGEHETD